MKCPRCGEVFERMDGETVEEFKTRWESDSCPKAPWNDEE